MSQILSLALALLLGAASAGHTAVRVKDIAQVDGVRPNQLLGYGLVVGLNGTGDKSGTQFTTQTTANLLERLGVEVSTQFIRLKNVAAVMVTADLPPFARAGQKVDVAVSSLGDAKSLQGGTLLLTPLRAPNGDVYAVAQGAVSIGGYSASSKGSEVQQNHPTAGRVPSGAVLERDAPLPDLATGELDLLLNRPDFSTAARVARALEGVFGPGVARAEDGTRVRVRVPQDREADPVEFLADVEGVTVEPDAVARVMVDEKTGTVVLGENVTVRPVAISHGNLTVQVTPYMEVSQPQAFSERGRTVARQQAQVQASEESSQVYLMEPGQSLSSLVQALNALGVSPRDLIAIFQVLKAAGALEADLEIM